MQWIVGASMVTLSVVCDLMCLGSHAKKVDEPDVCELKACSFATVHGRVTELSSAKSCRKQSNISMENWVMEWRWHWKFVSFDPSFNLTSIYSLY